MHFDLSQIVFEGALYDALKRLFWAFVMTGAVQIVLRYAFHRLQKGREIAALWVGGIVLFSALIYSLGTRPQEPHLIGNIEQALAGPSPSVGSRETVAALVLTVINTGTMQTIIKNWHVTATANNNTYDAAFGPMPSKFTFNNIPRTTVNQPQSITFYGQDNIVEKSLTPIQIGAMLPGVLFVVFQNVDDSVFRGGAIFTVTFEDVLSRKYSISIKSNGQIGQLGITPGTHTEMACPVPPSGLPKVGNPLPK